jgi:hypothetical protein
MEENIPSTSVKRQHPSDYTNSRPESKRLRSDLLPGGLNSNTIDFSTSVSSEIFGDALPNMDADEPSGHISASLNSPMWEWPTKPFSNWDEEFFDWDPEKQETDNVTMPIREDYTLEYDSYFWNPRDPEEVIYQKLKSMTTPSICYGAVSYPIFESSLPSA